MIIIFELAGIAALGAVVFILFRAARVRDDQPGLRMAAYLGLGAWIAFSVMLLVDFDAIASDPVGALSNLLIAFAVLAVVLGYRHILGLLKDRAGRGGS
ncbi:MAG: hypothetical protein AAF439_05510 [Pseudomonadota bacterium]